MGFVRGNGARVCAAALGATVREIRVFRAPAQRQTKRDKRNSGYQRLGNSFVCCWCKSVATTRLSAAMYHSTSPEGRGPHTHDCSSSYERLFTCVSAVQSCNLRWVAKQPYRIFKQPSIGSDQSLRLASRLTDVRHYILSDQFTLPLLVFALNITVVPLLKLLVQTPLPASYRASAAGAPSLRCWPQHSTCC